MNDKADIKDTSTQDIPKVLWTGGWDSTFRVLDLVLNREKTIQPHYILDNARRSTPVEIATMQRIRQMVKEMDRSAGERILNTLTMEIDKVPKNENTTSHFKRLLSISHLGSQYDWLARYAGLLGTKDLELCIHKDDKAEWFLRNDIRLIESNGESHYELVDTPSLAALNIFSCYRFPILDMTKTDMENKARQGGFLHIMEETWFCHSPTKEGKPCGICNPCKYTKSEGLARRVPSPSISTLARIFLKKMKKKAERLLPSQ